MFLKRTSSDVQQQQLYIGSIVTVYSRQLKLVDFGDTFTREKFARGKETTFALIKPDVYVHTGKIIDSIYKNGFIISKLKMGRFSNYDAQRLISIDPQAYKGDAQNFLTSDVCTGIEIVGDNALKKW